MMNAALRGKPDAGNPHVRFGEVEVSLAAMRLGKLGEQIVIKSRRAFSRLKFVSAVEAVRDDWLVAKENRDSAARRDYFDIRKTPYRLEDLSIQQIMQERIVPGDPRL